MKATYIKLFYVFLLLGLVSSVSSQLYNFHTYTVEDGLSQSQVKALFQDKSGNLWIGTESGGISKYNGKKYFNYTTVNGLSDNYVKVITDDKWGNIWIGTNQGISRYDGQEFKNFSYKNGLASNTVNSMCSDTSGNIWVGTLDGLCVLTVSDSIHNFYRIIKYGESDGVPPGNISHIFMDRKKKIWIGTSKGILKVDRKKGERKPLFVPITEKDGIASDQITSIAQDQNGYMWFATAKGVSKLVSKAEEKYRFLNYTTANGLLSDKVSAITPDSKGNLWFCTDLGVTRVLFENNTSKLQIINYTVRSGMGEGEVSASLEDREGNVWFGTANGLTRYSGSRFTVYTKIHGLLNNTVWAIVGDKNGDLLIGTEGGLCKLDLSGDTGHFQEYMDKYKLKNAKPTVALFEDRSNNVWIANRSCITRMEPLPGQDDVFKITEFKNKEYFDGIVYNVLEDSKGNIWFATIKGLVSYNGKDFRKYTKNDGLPDNKVYCLMEDSKGTLWIGTEKGLCSYDGQGFTKFASYSGLKLQVTSIVEDDSGNKWLGSFSGGGLTRFDGEKYKNISEADGLVSNTVYLMVVDNSGSLWIGTNKGLDLLDIAYYNKTDSVNIHHYSKNEGFTAIECNQNAVYKDFSGNIWFGTVKGIVKYNPKEDVRNPMAPIIQFGGIKLFNKEDVDWPKYSDSVDAVNGLPVHLKLPWDQNSITFSYLGVSLTNPERVRYKYKLQGFSDEWSDETTETTVPFPNLPYGHYTFYVKACNNDGVWSEPISFNFIITPPFWKTPWFYFLCIVVIALGIWRFISFRTKQLQQAKKILEQKIIERTRELHEKNVELEKLSIVARETVNAIAISTPVGEIEWINESFTRMTGYTLRDLKDDKGKSVYQASHNPKLRKIILDCVSNKKSKVYESLNETKDGAQIWVHTTLTPIFDESGRVKKLVFIDTDITESKQAEEIIRQKNKDMMDSINYAKLIQDAILPPKDEIMRVFPDSFIFFLPREVVSGDFYWFNIIGDTVYLAAADSTGHGVPGAFMSLIGSTLLNEIVNQKGFLKTDEILNELDSEIRKVLKQGQAGVETRDGMDIALCAINIKTKVVNFSGAMRPMYIINRKEDADDKFGDFRITEVNPDKRSIGGDQQGRVGKFSRKEIKLMKGDTIYMFTDGYADQFGGPKGKKITNSRFKEALLSLQVLSMNMQGKLLETDLHKWMGELEQVDDILVMGVKF